jgi:hypothetical protein
MIATLLLASALASPAPADPAIFAVIVGNNASDGGELADLRYADDDAARYHELLSMTGGQVEILSVLDADTQRVHPEVAERARVPRRDVLIETLDRTFEAVRDAERAGRRTSFYFVYVGHGSIGADGEGQMHLVGGRFSRSDLFQQVLAKSPATVNHVIIDACNAYLMVARRGDAVDVDVALDQFLAREDLSEYPNTGVLVSTSEATEVHEWSRFSAGVFSHEVRSALVGGADVDGDGRATYAEVRAFIAAANARIDNPKARLEVYAAAPRVNLREPIFDRAWAPKAATLRIPDQMAGRYFVEDGRGVRYADFHSSPDFAVTLTLVPRELYYLRSDDLEIRVPAGVLKTADASALPSQPIALAMRGSESDEFRRNLFALPFGRAYFEGYRASLPSPGGRSRAEALQPPAERGGLSGKRVAALTVAGAGAASLVASLVVGLGVQDLRDQYARAVGDGDDLARLEGQIDDRVLATNLLLGAGIGLVVTGATLWLWPE